MTAIEILNQLERLGVVATATPDGYLDLEPSDNLTDDLIETVRAHKAELLEHLGGLNPQPRKPTVYVPKRLREAVETALAPEQQTDPVLTPAEPLEDNRLLPTQSPWLDLAGNAQTIWDALEAQGTRTLHLIDQDGRKCCHCFTASKPADLRELAKRGLKTFPRVQRLTVVAVLAEVQIWQLEPRTVN